jgi:hypothetical protein
VLENDAGILSWLNNAESPVEMGRQFRTTYFEDCSPGSLLQAVINRFPSREGKDNMGFAHVAKVRSKKGALAPMIPRNR